VGRESLVLDVDVVTPMFGGGDEPRQVDANCIVRTPEVRGHLRFWWRAVEAARFASAKALFDEEKALWGSTESPGIVRTQVRVLDPGRERRHGEIAGSPSSKTGPGVRYFLFPFQAEKKTKAPEAKAQEGVRFLLHVDVHEVRRADVERAVRAWLTFGGVGARTRRGCGALRGPREHLPPPDERGFRDWLGGIAPTSPPGSPHTSVLSTVLLGPKARDAMDAWRQLATLWARFRKGHVGGESYQPMSGSHWADYDTLCSLKGAKAEALRLNKPFLGLPLIYQAISGAPFSGTLEPKDSGRMASPVILKPVALADGSVRPMIVLLTAPEPSEIRIRDGGGPHSLTTNPDDPVLRALRVDHPLRAVVAEARERWGRDFLQFDVGGRS
jgi:CRISPR-associated protein Cmr1